MPFLETEKLFSPHSKPPKLLKIHVKNGLKCPEISNIFILLTQDDFENMASFVKHNFRKLPTK